MHAAHQRQVLEAVLPLKTSSTGQSDARKAKAYPKVLARQTHSFWNFHLYVEFSKNQNNAYFHRFIVQKKINSKNPSLGASPQDLTKIFDP